MIRRLLPFLFLALAGCPVRVTPPTEAVCPSKPNCGQCATLPVCVWCAGSASGSCRPATHPGTCDGTIVSAEVDCPTDASGYHGGQ